MQNTLVCCVGSFSFWARRERERPFSPFSLFCLRVLLVPSTGSGFGYLFLPSFFFFFFASSSSSFSSTVLIGSQGVQDACATPRRTTPHWQFRPWWHAVFNKRRWPPPPNDENKRENKEREKECGPETDRVGRWLAPNEMTEGMCCSDPNLSPPLCTHTRTHTHTRRPSDTHDPSRSMRRDSPALLFYFFSFFLSLSSYYFSWSSLSNARANTQNCWTSGLSLVLLKEQQQAQHTKKFLFDQQGPRFVISSGPDAAGMSETRRHWHTQTSEIEWERERVGCDVALECKWLHNLKETCVIPVVSSLFWVCVFFLLSFEPQPTTQCYRVRDVLLLLPPLSQWWSRLPAAGVIHRGAAGARKEEERETSSSPPPPQLPFSNLHSTVREGESATAA